MREKKRRISTGERSPSGEGVARSDGKYSFRALRKKRPVYLLLPKTFEGLPEIDARILVHTSKAVCVR